MVEDSTEDRISEKARIEKIVPMEVVQKYTNDFHDTLKIFNLIPSLDNVSTIKLAASAKPSPGNT